MVNPFNNVVCVKKSMDFDQKQTRDIFNKRRNMALVPSKKRHDIRGHHRTGQDICHDLVWPGGP